MDRLQALSLVNELFAEKTVGVNSDGAEVVGMLNQHFLACCQVARPTLPMAYAVQAYRQIPLKKTDPSNRDDRIREARAQWAEFFREIADGITKEETEPRT